MPFVAEKVVEMLINILKQGDKDDATASNSKDAHQILEQEVKVLQEEKMKKKDVLRNKVLAMSRMMKIFKTLREDSE